MSKSISCVGFAILFCLLFGSGNLCAAYTTASYYPIQVGNSWTYNNSVSGTSTTTVLDGSVLVNGIATTVLEDSDGLQTFVTNDQDGIRVHRQYEPSVWIDGIGYTSFDLVYSPPMKFANAEATLGSVLESSGIATLSGSALGIYNLTYHLISAMDVLEEVTVPAGSYLCLKNSRTITVSGNILGSYVSDTSYMTSWLADGVGEVKSWYSDSDGVEEEVLIDTNVGLPLYPVVYHDYNGDMSSEILWRNGSNGQNRIWRMDGFTRTLGSNIMNMAGNGWLVGGARDFDADGKTDIMWRDQGGTGQNRLWLMDGFSRTSGSVLPLMNDISWVVGGIDDFDGDGKADILWRNTSMPFSRIWLMDTFVKKSGGTIPIMVNAWSVAGTGDFNDDGMADILWRNTVNGQNRIWLMNGLNQISGSNIPNMTDTDWAIGGVGDFDGDGKIDIFWRNPVNGQNRVWLMDGVTRTEGAALTPLVGAGWVVGSVGDYNADGKADILWRDSVTGFNMIWLMDGVNAPGIQQGAIPWLDSSWSAVK